MTVNLSFFPFTIIGSAPKRKKVSKVKNRNQFNTNLISRLIAFGRPFLFLAFLFFARFLFTIFNIISFALLSSFARSPSLFSASSLVARLSKSPWFHPDLSFRLFVAARSRYNLTNFWLIVRIFLFRSSGCFANALLATNEEKQKQKKKEKKKKQIKCKQN